MRLLLALKHRIANIYKDVAPLRTIKNLTGALHFAMKFTPKKYIFPATLALAAQFTTAHAVELMVDTNRDAVIDPATDAQGRDQWTTTRGAFFLFNNDSDLHGTEQDSADAVVNGEADLQDLAIMMASAIEGLPENATVTVSVDVKSLGNVRIFADETKTGNYTNVDLESKGNINPRSLATGNLELRIEAKSYASPAWNGKTKVTLTVHVPGNEPQSDVVELRVAPFIMLPSSAPGDTIYVREFPGRNDEMLKQLQTIADAANAKLHIIAGGEGSPYAYNNIWLQDTMEIGYHEFPGKKMSVVKKANRNKSLDNFPKNELLGPDYGWFEWSEYRESHGRGNGGVEWMDWYGNLEVTVPLPGFPFGRIFYGITPEGDSLNPEIVALLNAQEIQGTALGLDVGWLQIKHVDEMVSFVPTNNNGGFKVMVPDNTVAIQLLESFKANGHGDLEILQPFATSGFLKKYPKVTANAILEDAALLEFAKGLQETRIDPMINVLISELGINPEQIVRVPFLMEPGKTALFPNMINSLYLNGHLVIPDPTGPVVNGEDLIQKFMAQQFAEDDVELHFVDDRQYHKWSGNVHCATNVRREVADGWWKKLN